MFARPTGAAKRHKRAAAQGSRAPNSANGAPVVAHGARASNSADDMLAALFGPSTTGQYAEAAEGATMPTNNSGRAITDADFAIHGTVEDILKGVTELTGLVLPVPPSGPTEGAAVDGTPASPNRERTDSTAGGSAAPSPSHWSPASLGEMAAGDSLDGLLEPPPCVVTAGDTVWRQSAPTPPPLVATDIAAPSPCSPGSAFDAPALPPPIPSPPRTTTAYAAPHRVDGLRTTTAHVTPHRVDGLRTTTAHAAPFHVDGPRATTAHAAPPRVDGPRAATRAPAPPVPPATVATLPRAQSAAARRRPQPNGEPTTAYATDNTPQCPFPLPPRMRVLTRDAGATTPAAVVAARVLVAALLVPIAHKFRRTVCRLLRAATGAPGSADLTPDDVDISYKLLSHALVWLTSRRRQQPNCLPGLAIAALCTSPVTPPVPTGANAVSREMAAYVQAWKASQSHQRMPPPTTRAAHGTRGAVLPMDRAEQIDRFCRAFEASPLCAPTAIDKSGAGVGCAYFSAPGECGDGPADTLSYSGATLRETADMLAAWPCITGRPNGDAPLAAVTAGGLVYARLCGKRRARRVRTNRINRKRRAAKPRTPVCVVTRSPPSDPDDRSAQPSYVVRQAYSLAQQRQQRFMPYAVVDDQWLASFCSRALEQPIIGNTRYRITDEDMAARLTRALIAASNDPRATSDDNDAPSHGMPTAHVEKRDDSSRAARKPCVLSAGSSVLALQAMSLDVSTCTCGRPQTCKAWIGVDLAAGDAFSVSAPVRVLPRCGVYALFAPRALVDPVVPGRALVVTAADDGDQLGRFREIMTSVGVACIVLPENVGRDVPDAADQIALGMIYNAAEDGEVYMRTASNRPDGCVPATMSACAFPLLEADATARVFPDDVQTLLEPFMASIGRYTARRVFIGFDVYCTRAKRIATMYKEDTGRVVKQASPSSSTTHISGWFDNGADDCVVMVTLLCGATPRRVRAFPLLTRAVIEDMISDSPQYSTDARRLHELVIMSHSGGDIYADRGTLYALSAAGEAASSAEHWSSINHRSDYVEFTVPANRLCAVVSRIPLRKTPTGKGSMTSPTIMPVVIHTGSTNALTDTPSSVVVARDARRVGAAAMASAQAAKDALIAFGRAYAERNGKVHGSTLGRTVG